MEPRWMAAAPGGGGGGRGGGPRQAGKAQAPSGSRVPCRNFARGACRWGQNCRFSHDRKVTQICKYFQNGFCGYGDRCSYQHILEAPVLSRCGSESAYHGLQGGVLPLNRRGSEPAILPEASLCLCWSDSRSHEQKTDTTSLMSEVVPTKEATSTSLVSEEPKAARSSGAASDATAAAVAQSEDVVCGICMDKVSQKALPEERLFGILPNCTHAYCVGCIRKWRRSRDFHSAVIKGCPECRVTSSYFIPNKYWVFESEEKEKLIETFKARTSKIRCKFFVRGNGQCPFKSECIYLHELPRGQLPAARPRQRPERRRRQPIAYNLSPSDSSDEDDDDMYLVQWALTFALLHRDRDFDFSDFLWDSSDSSD
ncbi:hypothetical protein JD844_018309 [Phrynosoma platyrhinos]|uniref:RING-type E3 ubiquitin transferase n=1 Tax=Phrynosoma platyrhinos TaxID=52577 RepID=A0ABQ7SNC2_PHRPL|nr:hypothetical protein JD844_018309 [Phrynosoma platyrhinos]